MLLLLFHLPSDRIVVVCFLLSLFAARLSEAETWKRLPYLFICGVGPSRGPRLDQARGTGRRVHSSPYRLSRCHPALAGFDLSASPANGLIKIITHRTDQIDHLDHLNPNLPL